MEPQFVIPGEEDANGDHSQDGDSGMDLDAQWSVEERAVLGLEDDDSLTENTDDYSSSSMSDDDDDENDTLTRLLSNPQCHLDPLTMQLTNTERGWALALQQAVSNRPDLNEMSDLWITHYALVAGGNTQNALHRIACMQAFQEEYKVDNSVEQGVQSLEQLMLQQPGLLLSLDVDSTTLQGLHIMDCSRLHPDVALKTHRTWPVLVVGFYYYFLVCQPTLATIRNGQYTMQDYGEWDWHNCSLEGFSRFNAEFGKEYPIKFSRLSAYNTNSAANMMFALTKHIFPRSMMDAVQLGCQVAPEEGIARPLADIYLQPNLQECNHRMLTKARQLLSLRAKNDAGFRL